MTIDLLMSFLTLSLLEIVLGIDNLIFIALVAGQLPDHMRLKVRVIGLGLALFMRVGMLFGLSWIMQLTEPVLSVYGLDLSWRDLLLLVGGLFLIWKATHEIHMDMVPSDERKAMGAKKTYRGAITQIVLIDLVFSFDSIITAVGLSNNLYVMVSAVMVAMLVMLIASGSISGFLERHPTFKMLALTFIMLIGVILVADGLHFHIPKAYIYCSFAYACAIEALNIWGAKKRAKHKKS